MCVCVCVCVCVRMCVCACVCLVVVVFRWLFFLFVFLGGGGQARELKPNAILSSPKWLNCIKMGTDTEDGEHEPCSCYIYYGWQSQQTCSGIEVSIAIYLETITVRTSNFAR